MKLSLTLIILLTQSLVLASCGRKSTPVKTLQKQAVEIQDYLQKSQHEKDTELRKDAAFQRLGKVQTEQQYKNYVARISDDDPTNDQEVQ